MAIMVNREDDKNVELAQRISADLSAKADSKSKTEVRDVDLAEGSEYVKDFKKTGSFAWLWIIIGVVILIMLIAIGASRGV